jgi:ferredoxin
MARITIEEGRCIGAAQCVLTSARLFDQDEHGFVVVLDDSPTGEQVEPARVAARICPSQSITIHED